jgi:hypothetical protein
MQRRMIVIVSAALVMPFAAAWLSAGPSLAGPAADECISRPGASAPAGSHWYYRVNRADHRHCWYLGPVGAKVRSQARETAAPSPSRSPQRAAETRRAAAAETAPAPAPAAPAAAAPTEPPVPEDAVPQFAARWSDLPSSVAVGAREPAAASSAYAEEHANAGDEMPLIWPVLTEADLDRAPQSTLASGGRPTVLVGALALLLAGVVFKLTVGRRPGRPHRHDQAAVAPPHPFRSAPPEFADTAGSPARAVRAAVAMARRDDRRREPDERARDIEARLQQLRRDRLRAA